MENTTKGSLLPNDKALEYLRKQFVMSAKMQGRLGNFYQVHDVKYRGTDQHYVYKDPVQVAYHLNETPSRKILLRYGWFTEDLQQLPIILFLTFYDIENKEILIQEGCKIEITGKRTIASKDTQTEQFQITELRTDLELNQCVCKVVPVREEQKENVKVLADKKDPNLENVYLKREIYYDETGQDSIDEPSDILRRT